MSGGRGEGDLSYTMLACAYTSQSYCHDAGVCPSVLNSSGFLRMPKAKFYGNRLYPTISPDHCFFF